MPIGQPIMVCMPVGQRRRSLTLGNEGARVGPVLQRIAAPIFSCTLQQRYNPPFLQSSAFDDIVSVQPDGQGPS